MKRGDTEITGSLGDIFKIYSSDFDYTFVTIAEGANLKEINYIVFEDFTSYYSLVAGLSVPTQNIGNFQRKPR